VKRTSEETAYPPGLDALYLRMTAQIRKSQNAELCKNILAITSVVYQPITIMELASLANLPDGVSEDDLSEIVKLCGSFLTLRDRAISFIHQSAKDFLLHRIADEIFPSGGQECIS
jgi:hypothetical protein